MLEDIILGFLMKENLTGYDLKQWMIASTSYFYEASFGSIYPALKRLEDKGFIFSQESVQQGKYKNVYSITDKGKAQFLEWINKPIVFAKTGNDFLVRIFFYEYLPKETALSNISSFIKDVEPVLISLNNRKTELEGYPDGKQLFYMYSTLTYGIQYYEHIITWCKEVIAQIKEREE